MVTRLLVVIAVYSVFTQLYGPLLDHHFVERQPDHTHIYLGQAVTDHTHTYEVPHSHDESQDTSVGMGSTGAGDGIFFLPPDKQGDTGPSGFSFTTAMLNAFLALLIPAALIPVFRGGQTAIFRFIPLLKPPPPRLAL